MVTIELRGANHAARQSQTHLARVTVNLTFDDVPPMLVRGTEEANVFGSKLRVQSGDENRRAEGPRESRRMVGEWVARWRTVDGIELRGRGPSQQRVSL